MTGATDGAAMSGWTLIGGLRQRLIASVDHERVVARIVADSGWAGRYAFMILMSAGIAVLGLLLSSPPVAIGAMPCRARAVLLGEKLAPRVPAPPAGQAFTLAAAER